MDVFMKKIKLYLILLMIAVIPSSVFAAAKTSTGSNAVPAHYDSNNNLIHAKVNKWGSECFNKYGMTISADPYSRKAGYAGNGVYYNDVSPRKVTITFKNAVSTKYKVYIYQADYGEISKLSNSNTTNDDDEDDDGEDYIKPKVKTIKANYGKTVWDDYSVPAGKEALIIVISNGKKKLENKKIVCLEYDKDGNCINWHKDTVYCKAGKYSFQADDDEDDSVDGNAGISTDVEIKGVAAAFFVENPKNTGKVTNLRRTIPNGTNACSKASRGEYNGSKTEYSINATNYPGQDIRKLMEDWNNNYYGRLLEDCNQVNVDFNMKESQIKELSNLLLETFYHSNKMKSDSTTTSDDINKEITTLQNRIRELYPMNSDYNDHYIEGNGGNISKSLSCKYNKVNGKQMLEDEYLYVDKAKPETAELSDGEDTEDVTICTTKCYEHLTVRYDPPATVKAGICFSYKVTVKSVSKCGIDINDDFWSYIKKPNTCSPVPICENNSSSTQAGPNKKFDSCVKTCDGGKYTQSCINSCYNQVYNSKNKKDSKVSKQSNKNNNKYDVQKLIYENTNSKAVMQLIENDLLDYSESELAKYYKLDDNSSNRCTTAKLISYRGNETKLRKCAKYFFEAKTLDPKGTYNAKGTNWKPDDSITRDVGMNASHDPTAIPMQIGRASPFYLRDEQSAYELLVDLVGTSKRNVWYKYAIKNNGIKQQNSERYVCTDSCSYTGCQDVEKPVFYSSAKYTSVVKSNLNHVNNALKNCIASTACDTEEKETEYEINITSSGVSGKGGSNGTTTVYSTDGKAWFNDGDETKSMFTSENIDEFGNSTDSSTQTGILGLCYDRRNNPHYQTTITYPGTSINYKTGARKYVEDTDEPYYFKKKKFCTPYDDKDVNRDYAYWAIINKYNPDTYPSNFKPDTYNIEAQLGKTNKGFGKYNWKIDFKCFYSSMSDLVTVCTPDVDCPNPPTCQPTDPNYPICSPPITTKCSNGECDECSSAGSGRICNVNFRVVDSTNLFPDPTKASGKKDEKDVAFNWTSKAQDMDTSTTYGQALQSRGYMINPTEYRHSIEDTAGNNSEYYYGGIPMYHIKLTRENISDLKGYVKDHGYNTYGGTYTKVENTEMRYYNISSDVKGYIDYFDNSNAHLGYNNK